MSSDDKNRDHFRKSRFQREHIMGVFLLTRTNAFLSSNRVFSVNTSSVSRIYEFQPTHEGVSKLSGQAREWCAQVKRAERSGASERSEQCERTNIASDQEVRLKGGCPWVGTGP